MAIPDKLSEQSTHSFQWTNNPLSLSADIHAHTIGCNTIVFDSFSSEEEVKQRNVVGNNVRKINDSNRRFSTDFRIRFSGRVSAVLSPSSIGSYRVVDAKRKSHHSPPASSQPSFSSIISSTSPVSNKLTSTATTTTTPHAQEDDSQLIASLASACTAASSTTTAKTTFVAELSLVAERLALQQPEESTLPKITGQTDQHLKCCQTMMMLGQQHQPQPQPLMVNYESFPPSAPAPPTQQRFSLLHTKSINHVTSNPPVVAADQQHSGFFFAPIPRPTEVERTLLHLLQTENRNKRARGGMDEDGHALHCCSSEEMIVLSVLQDLGGSCTKT